jgi:hypothetical protein
MKTTLKKLFLAAVILTLAPALFAQDFDFTKLDKLAAIAKSSTNLTLDASTLKMAAAFLGSDNDKDAAAIKSLVANIKGIYIRAYEFDKPGQYAESDVAPLRAYLKQPRWKAILESKDRDGKEWTQVFLLPSANDTKLGGLAVVSTEPTSLTVVYIDGELNPDDLRKLSGNLGIPEIDGLQGKPSDTKKTDNKSGK